jgi:hypothetical protein
VPSTHSRGANGTAHLADERPRLVRLVSLLEEWHLDAQAAHLAYTTGTPRGPITSLPSLDREPPLQSLSPGCCIALPRVLPYFGGQTLVASGSLMRKSHYSA